MHSRPRTYSTFAELLYWSYANLQMLHYAVNAGKDKYDRTCYMIRSKAYKSYMEGRWNIHDLLQLNIEKIQRNDCCWYCGQPMAPALLTRDHVFPRSKGGDNDMDNIIMVCKSCNSSKGDNDLFRWYREVRHAWPSIPVWAHYLKNIYLYATAHNLMNQPLSALDQLDLPFDWQYIPTDYPQPIDLKLNTE